MSLDSVALSILISGQMEEEEEKALVGRRIIEEFSKYEVNVKFYFLSIQTVKKMLFIFQSLECQVLESWEKTQIDFIITIGGDGTILYTAKQIKTKTPPFISFQKGTLGFLCKFSITQIQSVVKNIIFCANKHHYHPDFPFTVHKMIRLQGEIYSSTYNKLMKPRLCLNQVSISREKSERIVLSIFVNYQFLTETSGDGILVSTPTGSTAYALSAGGPIIENGVNCILIVPLAPNSLSFRPICLPSTCVVQIKLSKQSRGKAVVSFDGQYDQIFTQDQQILIKVSDKDLLLYEPKENDMKMPSWMQRLKHFLGWNEVFKSPDCSSVKKEIKNDVQGVAEHLLLPKK